MLAPKSPIGGVEPRNAAILASQIRRAAGRVLRVPTNEVLLAAGSWLRKAKGRLASIRCSRICAWREAGDATDFDTWWMRCMGESLWCLSPIGERTLRTGLPIARKCRALTDKDGRASSFLGEPPDEAAMRPMSGEAHHSEYGWQETQRLSQQTVSGCTEFGAAELPFRLKFARRPLFGFRAA